MARTKEPDHYATLGVDADASATSVKSAYRRLSLELHPDRNRATDAHARMAAVNAAYAVLSSARRRAEYDRSRPPPPPVRVARREPAPRPLDVPEPIAKLATEGCAAPQPERLPDWYEFLDLRMNASTAEVIIALNALGAEVSATNYTVEDEARLRLNLKRAAETLTNPRVRAVYDAALCGTPPPPGQYLHLHRDWYSFLGVRKTASVERIAEQVTALSGKVRKAGPEYREIATAWVTLRDADKRREYDRRLRG